MKPVNAAGRSAVLALIGGLCVLAARCNHGAPPESGMLAGKAAEPLCRVVEPSRPLPADVRETSGLARGIENRDVLWTHNDSGNEPELFALGLDGSVRGRVRITGARNVDWEDIEAGRCGSSGCLYIADMGDNAGRRASITIYEIAEPEPGARDQPVRRTIAAAYPDGPQDAESLFRLPSGELYVVTKGRQHSIKLYRLQSAGDRAANPVLQLVREIGSRPASPADWVTAATASPDGEWVALRSYRTLYIYRTNDLLSGELRPRSFDLSELRERQGESLALENDGTVWLSSEAENPAELPAIARLSCTLR